MIDDGARDEELFLGFDARRPPSEIRAQWPLSRRRKALLRLDVTAPVSVDYLVWPSAWPLDFTILDWRGPVQGLWDNEARLKSRLASVPGRWWVVAVVLEWWSVPLDAAEDWRQRTTELEDGTEWRRWKPIGYDVADRFLTSGMLWFRPGEDPEALRTEWGHHLTKRHLFSQRESAARFQDFSNKRAPEHAPYFVYRLFRSGQPAAD